MLYNILHVKGGNSMNYKGVESKKGLAIFDKSAEKVNINSEIVTVACNYLLNQIEMAGKRQISYELGNGIINLSEDDLINIKKNLYKNILKKYPVDDTYLMLWTSDGEYFDQIGVDPLLKQVMEKSGLSTTVLPSNLVMWIYPKKVMVEEDLECIQLYNCDKKIK